MRNPSIEKELNGSLKFLDKNQKKDVLTFINKTLIIDRKSIMKREAIKAIRTDLTSNVAF